MRVNNSKNPYYDPLSQAHRIETHPHSNVATARKKTFSDKWQAGYFSSENGRETFTLSQNYASTLVSNMSKGGKYTGLCPTALACWLYRDRKFSDTTSIDQLAEILKSEFNFSEDEWGLVFSGNDSGMDIQESQSWSTPLEDESSKTMLDILSRDPLNFNYYYSLLALKELNNMPIIEATSIKDIIDKSNLKQIVLQGPPGTGKTYSAKQVTELIVGASLDTCRSDLETIDPDARWGIIQFHPSYGYEDFVQRQVPTRDTDGTLRIEVTDMPFVICCKIAMEIYPEPFVLIIDEMNRSDLQKVFGELMYSLEYRGEQISTQYKKSEMLTVPENLVLIGTMNTADSSVVQVDYAIRRRFVFVDLLPDESILAANITDEVTRNAAVELFRATNTACGHHPRFSIGHTYFLRDSLETLIHSFVYQVLPTLRTYQDNGVISEDVSIQLNKWDSEAISPSVIRNDALVSSLVAWGQSL
jgi:AAA domain (dynein-related subfamily)